MNHRYRLYLGRNQFTLMLGRGQRLGIRRGPPGTGSIHVPRVGMLLWLRKMPCASRRWGAERHVPRSVG